MDITTVLLFAETLQEKLTNEHQTCSPAEATSIAVLFAILEQIEELNAKIEKKET